MGVYLSEPNTSKEIKEGSGGGIVYCKAEMQGSLGLTQVGENRWKMLRSMKPISATATAYSASLTVTEVLFNLHRPRGQQVRRKILH